MANLSFPPPTDHQEFERLICDLAGPIFRTRNVNLNGRSGQAQHGVDVSVLAADGRNVGIQCKLTGNQLSVSTVQDEIAKATTYTPPLDEFILATSAPADAPLEAAVRGLPKVGFDIAIWSWNKINNYLNRTPAVSVPYAQHILMGSTESSEQEHAMHLREALDRPAFLRKAHYESGFLDQREAVRDTSAFLRTGYLYTRDDNFVSGLPYIRYSEPYAKHLATLLGAIDSLDTYLARHLNVLNDPGDSGQIEALMGLDAKRLAVLKAANRLLVQFDIPKLVPAS